MPRRPIHRFRSYLLDRLVLRPSRDPLDCGIQRRVMMTSKQGPLETFFRQSDPTRERPDLLVLKFPGTAGRAERATAFPTEYLSPAQNVHLWTWNPPGYGRSAGRATLRGIAKAALEFHRQVTEKYAEEQGEGVPPIWLSGNSLGCVTALHVAAASDQKAYGLLLRNPPPIDLVVRRIAKNYPLGALVNPVTDQLTPAMNAIHTAEKVTGPGLFLQSERDTLVPPAMQQLIRNVYAGPQRMVELRGLSHDGLIDEEHQASVREAVEWLWKRTRVTGQCHSRSGA
ncbi:Alpha/beta hydrolase family protein [Planctomycetes bacterium CA13]|uniref:Alpha/beta hydrolase family protein n=1 Tax=Novipirellula herctigrandis TaxID=2527986 RepID=A0A5C5Z2N3_9BACT|nr:Alpha/beta hydrolase family protein [Planctomycetes bacterium CA13]